MKPGGSTTIIRRHPKRARTGARAKKSKSTKTISPSGINAVPVEVLTEIFKNAHPADLISLSRTSKSFRNILMKPSAEPIWRCAESNVPGLPSYPWADISKPRYAALMFTKNCTECGKYTAINVDPFLLVRLCADCRDSVLIPAGDWKFRTSDANSLVLKTNRIKYGHPDRDQEYSRHVYSLATEVEKVNAMVKAFSRTPLGEEFNQWKEEVRREVDMRRQFGAQVSRYLDDISNKNSQELEVIKKERMAEIETRLQELGWTDRELDFRETPECGKWLVLVKRIRPVTEETWGTLLPKLTPLLEANRARIKKLDAAKRRETHTINIHRYLNTFRLENHPLATFIDALDVGHLLEEDATPDGPILTLVSNFLDRYPFPDTPTVLCWPFVKKLVDTDKNVGLTATFVRFAEVEDRIDFRVTKFIEKIEGSFTSQLIPESTTNAAKYRAKRSTPPLGTDELPWDTQVLLRADVVFADVNVHKDDPEQPQEFYYYTDCLRPRGDRNTRTYLSGRAARYCRYEKAEEVASALLECLGMPNASYLELAILGNIFSCERCSSLELMDWKGILKHYLDELHIWSALSAFKSHPKFRPRCPVYMTNVHKLDDLLDSDGDCLPLISLLDEDGVRFQLSLMDEEKDMDSWYCAPCRNYGRRYVSQGLVSFHMWNCHHVREVDTTEGVHYFLLEDAISFLERGGAWAESWDAHHKGREEDLEVDDEDIWN